jgi:S-adenosylmethionine-diacylglycerol 3-amino-3-carboxypropyl transferase
LLELKLAGIRRLAHPDFFRIFGLGRHEDFARIYNQMLRSELSEASRQVWDRRTRWFTGRGRRSGLYYRGLSGLVARLMRSFIDHSPTLARLVDELLDCRDLERQRRLYDQIEPRLFTRSLNWALERQLTMSLLGVPWAQREEVAASHDDGIAGFIRSCLDHVGRQLPFHTNYFWSVYLRGHYTPSCCPSYLTEDGFARLQGGLVDRVEPHTSTVTQWLRSHQTRVSRFVLLDHMDWMGTYYPHALADEWGAILDRAAPAARVLFRSGARQPAFLDEVQVSGNDGALKPLRRHLRFHPELAARLDREDRVHTYASFHIADLEQ